MGYFCRASGLSFVAISLVRAALTRRSLNDLAFLSNIGREWLQNIGGLDRLKDDMQRQENPLFQDLEHINIVQYYFEN